MKTENKYFIFDNPKKCGVRALVHNALCGIKAFFIKAVMDVFAPKRKTEPEYKVSVCAIFKNEARYFKEWIEFHKIIGVEHFYLYDNNSTDDFMPVLKEYIKQGIVTLVKWEKDHSQMEAYKDCIKNYSSETRWLGFIDLDEFIVPKRTDGIYDFLKSFEKNRPAVMIYWKIFGTSGLTERPTDGLVTEDFTVCWQKHADIGKCFYNTKYSFDYDTDKNGVLHHKLWTKYGIFKLPPVNEFDKAVAGDRNKAKNGEFPIQINHYFTKSYKEYQEKKSKGDVYFKLNPHDEEYFYHHETKCTGTDFSAYKYLVKLKLAIKDADNE